MTITLTREEAQQVLDAMANAAWCVQHNNLPPDDGHDWDKELELLRVRLSAPEPEPVAWIKKDRSSIEVSIMSAEFMRNEGFEPLYTAPPQREWQELTDKEVLADDVLRYHFGLNGGAGPVSKKGKAVIEAIEAKLKEKNT